MILQIRHYMWCAIGFVLTGCDAPDTAVHSEPLLSPAGVESFAPQLFDVNGRISLSWLEADANGHALRYASWQDGQWSAAQTVARGDDWFANWADLPGVRPLQGGGWVAWWLRKSAADTYAYDVKLAFSDDGVQWREVASPHSDGTQTEHGFVTAFDLPEGDTGLAWLDGRDMQATTDHAHHGAGGMSLRYGIFGADGLRISEGKVDSLTCDCCQTDSARTGDATVLAYRDRTTAEIRDILVARFEDSAWSEPVRVHADNWKIDACPVNGPAIAADGDLVAVAWFTAPEGHGEVRVALSTDGGRSFGEPVRIDDGHPLGRVDLVMDPRHGVLATWIEQGETGASILMRHVSADGTAGQRRVLAATGASRAAGFPRMVSPGDGSVLLTWTEVTGDARQVRTARIELQPSRQNSTD